MNHTKGNHAPRRSGAVIRISLPSPKGHLSPRAANRHNEELPGGLGIERTDVNDINAF